MKNYLKISMWFLLTSLANTTYGLVRHGAPKKVVTTHKSITKILPPPRPAYVALQKVQEQPEFFEESVVYPVQEERAEIYVAPKQAPEFGITIGESKPIFSNLMGLVEGPGRVIDPEELAKLTTQLFLSSVVTGVALHEGELAVAEVLGKLRTFCREAEALDVSPKTYTKTLLSFKGAGPEQASFRMLQQRRSEQKMARGVRALLEAFNKMFTQPGAQSFEGQEGYALRADAKNIVELFKVAELLMQENSAPVQNAPQGRFFGWFGRKGCLLYTSPSPRDGLLSRMPSSA